MAPAKALSSTQVKQPLFSFGVITDVQYADIPDGRSFMGVPRHYRHSLQVLQRAITRWNIHRKLSFSINFGDIVDGFCPKDQSFAAVKKILDEFSKFNGPVFHMIGNHCLYNLPRSNLTALFNIPSIHGSAYYEFSPSPEYRFVILDAYDISAIGWPRDDPKTSQALKILHAKNPNEDKNNPGGLSGRDRRFVLFNGGIGREQLLWLDNILKDSTERDQKVIICCHLPLDPAAAALEALLWNYDEVIDVIHRYRCVKACLSGHDHKGGYAVDSHGVHHRVLEAAVECPPGSNAFGYVEVYHDRLSLVGADRMVSTEMIFEA